MAASSPDADLGTTPGADASAPDAPDADSADDAEQTDDVEAAEDAAERADDEIGSGDGSDLEDAAGRVTPTPPRAVDQEDWAGSGEDDDRYLRERPPHW